MAGIAFARDVVKAVSAGADTEADAVSSDAFASGAIELVSAGGDVDAIAVVAVTQTVLKRVVDGIVCDELDADGVLASS